MPHALAALALALAALGSPSSQEPGTVTAFRNGRWYDGDGFVTGDRFVVDGVLRMQAPGPVHTDLDLDGQWVVPPYGDAHTHLLEPDAIEAYVDLFLRRGVFYVRDQSTLVSNRRRFDEVLNGAEAFDYVSANQGFTGPGGHPLQIFRQLQGLGILPAEWTLDDLQGEGVFVVESASDLEQAWPTFRAGRPDFLKLFLLYSEVHDQRSGDERYLYRRGLDPELVKPLVTRARADGLPVSAHVYTRADFRTAVDGGVSLIAHCPGIGYEEELGDDAFLLTGDDAEAAARARVQVVTTLSEPVGLPGSLSSGAREYVDRIIAPNLALLAEAGVTILIGSDRPRMTADVEALALKQLDLFDEWTLLRMWCVDTPRSIFPGRKIGSLADGYEASFLVLEGDPLEDFANTQRIALRVKQGRILLPREPEFPPMGR